MLHNAGLYFTLVSLFFQAISISIFNSFRYYFYTRVNEVAWYSLKTNVLLEWLTALLEYPDFLQALSGKIGRKMAF